ncbi:MAG: hypothetical protein WBM11_03230, partial [Terriglobales bacterium]
PRPAVAQPKPAAVEPKATPPQSTMREPSLLGLRSEPTERERLSYLLEDEPESNAWKRWLAVLIFLAAVGSAAWYWRAEIRGRIDQTMENPATEVNPSTSSATPTTSAPESVPSSPATNPPPAVPAPAMQAPTTATPAATTSTPMTQTATPENQPAPTSAATPAPSPAAAAGTTTPAATPSNQAITEAVSRAPEKAAAPAPNPASQGPTNSAATPITEPPTATHVAPRPAKPMVERKAPVADAPVDALEAEGENYLYGHGVPEDCRRASKNLLVAAARSSAKAQSVLGTMYATGHCVTRDVPTAYRWFAKALHQDPGNVRIQQDLEVLWRQMTEEERKLAMQSGP